MRIVLNGKETEVKNAGTLGELLADLQMNPKLLACELNCKIIKKQDYGSARINEGDRLEILQMIGGG